jgi:hypothetical protein
MSTEYRHASTDEWVCTRWACRRILDDGAMAFDFGSPDRLDAFVLGGDLPVASESGHVTSFVATNAWAESSVRHSVSSAAPSLSAPVSYWTDWGCHEPPATSPDRRPPTAALA